MTKKNITKIKKNITKMKWEDDLVKDIRTFSKEKEFDGKFIDDSDSPDTLLKILSKDEILNLSSYCGPIEITECNRKKLKEQFLEIKDNCSSILEIGIGRNQSKSFCHVFFDNKKTDTKYIGLDVEDRSWVIDEGNEIYFLQSDSSDYDNNISIFKNSFGLKSFDFIFIDGWHSINQVLIDWQYTNLLNPGGIVGFHDTSKHPGPYMFIRNLDKNKWDVIENSCPEDWGIGFARLK